VSISHHVFCLGTKCIPPRNPPPKLRSQFQVPNFRLSSSGKPTRIPKFKSQSQFMCFRCSPLRSSNSGANFRSEHLPGPKFRSQNAGDNLKSCLSTSTQGTRIQVSKDRSHNPGSPNSGVNIQIIIIQASNFRFQFQIPLSRVCLSVGRETTTAQPSRSRTLNLKIIKTSSSITSFGNPRPNSKYSNSRSSSQIRSHLEFSFSLSSLFCFDESSLTHYPPPLLYLPLFRSQISGPQISYLNLKSPNSGADFSIFFLFSLFCDLHNFALLSRLPCSLALLRSRNSDPNYFIFPLHPFFVICIN
jgi:hypothetical protein